MSSKEVPCDPEDHESHEWNSTVLPWEPRTHITCLNCALASG